MTRRTLAILAGLTLVLAGCVEDSAPPTPVPVLLYPQSPRVCERGVSLRFGGAEGTAFQPALYPPDPPAPGGVLGARYLEVAAGASLVLYAKKGYAGTISRTCHGQVDSLGSGPEWPPAALAGTRPVLVLVEDWRALGLTRAYWVFARE